MPVPDVSALERDEIPAESPVGRAVIRCLELDEPRLLATSALLSSVRKLRPPSAPAQHHELPLTEDERFCETRRAFQSRGWADIELIADTMRRMLPVPARGRLFALDLFERLDELTLPVESDDFRVEYAIRRLPYRVEARTRVDLAARMFEVAISPECYGNMLRGFPRMLFTVCHEIGHLVLHRAELVSPRASIAATPLPPYATTEWQASAFAIAFIAPVAELLKLQDELGFLSPLDICRTFGCSREAAEWRLRSAERQLNTRIMRFDSGQMPLPFSL